MRFFTGMRTVWLTAALILGPACLVADGQSAQGAAKVCNLAITDIKDARPYVAGVSATEARGILESDASEWLRQGVAPLAHGTAIRFASADNSDSPALSASIELLKLNLIVTGGWTQAVNVVLRVRYARPGLAPEEQIYRGEANGPIWFDLEREKQSTIDRALARLLDDVKRDILARCG